MEQVFRIEGMHCGGCVARVTRALKSIADDVEVTTRSAAGNAGGAECADRRGRAGRRRDSR